jgi:hypothetical protein
MARYGLGSQALVYLLLAWLTFEIAVRGRGGGGGSGGQQANQQGALAEVISHPGGVVLVAIMSAGFGCYALWRLSEAVFGSDVNHSALDRALSGFRAAVYGALCVSSAVFLAGSRQQNQAQEQATWTARVMREPHGPLLIEGVGVVVIACGIGMFVEALLRRFERQLDRQAIPSRLRVPVVGLGLAGAIARAAVVMLIGGLVIDAAVTANPQKSTGLDGALRTLAGTTGGPWLLGIVGLGFTAFALYVAATARWIKS